MNKIVFFDIDGTLFDTAKFLIDFRANVSSEFEESKLLEMDFSDISTEVKNEKGYFIPSHFLDKVSSLSPKIDRQKLNDLFWDNTFISDHLYPDSSIVPQIPSNVIVGIFSQGDEAWQKQKINSLKTVINDENIYVFPDKLTNAKSVFDRYQNSSISLIDNDMNVIKTIKNLFSGINCILIDRQGDLEDNVGVRKIKNLNELTNLI